MILNIVGHDVLKFDLDIVTSTIKQEEKKDTEHIQKYYKSSLKDDENFMQKFLNEMEKPTLINNQRPRIEMKNVATECLEYIESRKQYWQGISIRKCSSLLE